jgi:hypothetical protein
LLLPNLLGLGQSKLDVPSQIRRRLAIRKNLILLSRNPIAHFLDVLLQFIEIQLFSFFYDSIQYGLQILPLMAIKPSSSSL